MIVPHPIPYQGSKRLLADAILRFFPPRVERLVEPFAGSAAVSLAAALKRKARNFVLNDKNAALMQLWREIISHPARTASSYRTLWEEQQGREREFYDQVRAEFNRTGRPDYFLYLLARCVKASVRYNADGQFNQSPDNRRKGSNPDTMERYIRHASQLFKGKTLIFNMDYRQLLTLASPDDLIYMDPPYQGVCNNRDPRYIENVEFNGFVEALEMLNEKEIMYIISYDGRTGDKAHGKHLPPKLRLKHLEIEAGRSSQATLLGRQDETFESLYLSSALVSQLESIPGSISIKASKQLSMFQDLS
jgi:DNA adenine methylase